MARQLSGIQDVFKSAQNTYLIKSVTENIHPADIFKTHGSNKRLINLIKKFKLTNTEIAIKNPINSYKKSLLLDPNSVDTYNNLAAIYIDEAIGYEEEYNNLAINASQKKYDQLSKKIKKAQLNALPYLEKILLLKPEDNNIVNRLKQIYYQLGEQDKSISMKKLIELQGLDRENFVKDFFAN